jgi:hypothetical protein
MLWLATTLEIHLDFHNTSRWKPDDAMNAVLASFCVASLADLMSETVYIWAIMPATLPNKSVPTLWYTLKPLPRDLESTCLDLPSFRRPCPKASAMAWLLVLVLPLPLV